MKVFLVILVVLCLAYSPVLAQNLKVHMNWDYKNPEKEKAFQVWKQYVNQNEGRDTFWHETDIRKFKGVDLLKSAVGFGGHLYKFRFSYNVLSISGVENDFLIKTALYSVVNDSLVSDQLNLFAIVNVMAIKTGNTYKLSNYLNYTTANWKEEQIGNIVYHYPYTHHFDRQKAIKANAFIDTLQDWFGFTAGTLHYYIPLNCTEGYRMVGFDYYQGEGKEPNLCGYFDDENNIIYSNSTAGELYRHELIHTVNRSFPNANAYLLAGLSAYIDDAGSMGKSEKEHIRIFQKYMETHPTDLNKFTEIRNVAESTVGVYIFRAVICNALLKKGGLPLLKEALNQDTESDERLIAYLQRTLAIADFNDFFNREFKLFLKQPNVLLRTESGQIKKR